MEIRKIKPVIEKYEEKLELVRKHDEKAYTILTELFASRAYHAGPLADLYLQQSQFRKSDDNKASKTKDLVIERIYFSHSNLSFSALTFLSSSLSFLHAPLIEIK